MTTRKTGPGGVNWETFWNNVWYNVFHGLGLIAVIAVLVGLVWMLAQPTKTKTSEKTSEFPREVVQSNFNKALMAAPRPCAVKEKSGSDLTNCSLLGVKLGMSVDDVKNALDGSGYFKPSSLNTICSDKSDNDCGGFVRGDRDGLSATFRFGKSMAVREITLVFGSGIHPYYEPEALRGTFVKMIGAPDGTRAEHDSWGPLSGKDGASMRAYSYSGSYWVILEKK